jgi:hypothetical protein
MPTKNDDINDRDLFHVSIDRCVAFLLDGVRLERWEEGHLLRCHE